MINEKLTIRESNFSRERFDLLLELILDEVDAHGDENESQEDVESRYVQVVLVAVVLVEQRRSSGYEVAESDGCECREAKVQGVEAAPILERAEYEHACE